MARVSPLLACAGAAFGVLVGPAEAATTRYVAPNGDVSAPCTKEVPCDLEAGIEGAADGDEVIIASGDYGAPATPRPNDIATDKNVKVHGIDGQARPTLYTNSTNGVSFSNAGATVAHFGVVNSVGFGLILVGATADRVYASGASACYLTGNATLRNSVCRNPHPSGGYAIEAGGPATIRGVTAWSSGTFSVGLIAKSGTVTVVSSILQGTNDVQTSELLMGISVAVNLTFSNYDTESETTGDPITNPGSGSNQTTAPVLVNPAQGDFHQEPASPTVDKGEPAAPAVTGLYDIDCGARTTGTGPDIGADEFAVVGAANCPTGGGGPGGTDGVAPSMTSLAFSNAAFRPLRSGGSIAAAARGTRVFYQLSEPASVGFRVERAAPGRRVGRRCARPTRSNRARRRCTRWVRVRGSFTHAGAAGANSFRFSGRMRGRALRRGKYRLVGTPVDAAGNRGKPARRGFRILRAR
jgi:hypothetical protein